MKLREKLLRRRCFRGIDDLPVWNWWRLHETGDLTFLMKKQENVSEYGTLALQTIWRGIYSEYIDRFGFSEEFQEVLQKRKAIALLKIEKELSGDRSLQTEINVEQFQLDRMLSDNVKADFMDIKKTIEKELRFHLNIKTISVAEFYGYLSSYNRSARSRNAEQGEI